MIDTFERLVTPTDTTIPPDVIRAKAYALVANMTHEEATGAMELLITHMEEDWVRRVLLLRGDLLDRIEDAMFLSTDERQAKWEQVRQAQQNAETLQKEWSIKQQKDSERRLLNRRRNRIMLERVRAENPTEGEENRLWATPLEELVKKPPPFWFALPLEECSEREQRLTVGVLEELASMFGQGRFPPSLWERYDAILQSLPMPPPTVARAVVGTRKHWLRRWCCRSKPRAVR